MTQEKLLPVRELCLQSETACRKSGRLSVIAYLIVPFYTVFTAYTSGSISP